MAESFCLAQIVVAGVREGMGLWVRLGRGSGGGERMCEAEAGAGADAGFNGVGSACGFGDVVGNVEAVGSYGVGKPYVGVEGVVRIGREGVLDWDV